MNEDTNKKWVGYLFVLTGATLWGVGGTVSQRLFHEDRIPVEWLVSVRLLLSGIILLMLAVIFSDRNQVFGIWKHKNSILQIMIFGILGMLAVQYTFMVSINLGNAAVATLLQYLAPLFIMVYLLLSKKTKLQSRNIVAVFLALAGTSLLLTDGSLSSLSVPVLAVVWGVLSGIVLAFYTLYAGSLLKKWGSLNVIGWAMIVGGFTLGLFYPPWQVDLSSYTLDTWIFLLFVIFFGTMFAFWLYLESLKYLNAQETSLLGSVEPLSAIVTSVVWLNISFGIYQWLGGFIILTMVIYLSLKKEAPAAKVPQYERASTL